MGQFGFTWAINRSGVKDGTHLNGSTLVRQCHEECKDGTFMLKNFPVMWGCADLGNLEYRDRGFLPMIIFVTQYVRINKIN